jgi:hypothetical protein
MTKRMLSSLTDPFSEDCPLSPWPLSKEKGFLVRRGGLGMTKEVVRLF